MESREQEPNIPDWFYILEHKLRVETKSMFGVLQLTTYGAGKYKLYSTLVDLHNNSRRRREL